MSIVFSAASAQPSNNSNQTNDTVQPPFIQVCEPNEIECYKDSVRRCREDGSAWIRVQKCDFECENNECVEPPPEPVQTTGLVTAGGPELITIAATAIIVVAALLIIVVSRKRQ